MAVVTGMVALYLFGGLAIHCSVLGPVLELRWNMICGIYHLQTLPFDYDKNRTATVSRMVNDLNEIAGLAWSEACSFQIIMLVGSFFAADVYLNKRLALIVYLLVPVMIWFALKYRRR